ncbi:MAG: glycosyltransferase family 2 protein [Cyanobacteria bacterium P01_G01_bin.19]
MKTPVAITIFNRPDTTKKVFEAIRQAKPEKLLVIADGPRADKPGEAEKCAEARAIFDRVDWKCEVLTNFSEVNLGCGKRPYTGFDWVFSLVEEAIVLEDDCLPQPTFFRFCEEMLEKYRDNEQVMAINGSNWLKQWQSKRQSYHFSYFFSGWGWASWRSTWQKYDFTMAGWQDPAVQQRIRDYIGSDRQFFRLKRDFDAASDLISYDIWDYQFQYMCLIRSGLVVVPSVNLISNVGAGVDATHTKDASNNRIDLFTYPMSFPLVEPQQVTLDRRFMSALYRRVWDNSLPSRIRRKSVALAERLNYFKPAIDRYNNSSLLPTNH